LKVILVRFRVTMTHSWDHGKKYNCPTIYLKIWFPIWIYFITSRIFINGPRSIDIEWTYQFISKHRTIRVNLGECHYEGIQFLQRDIYEMTYPVLDTMTHPWVHGKRNNLLPGYLFSINISRLHFPKLFSDFQYELQYFKSNKHMNIFI
jgi:hypothetical protein